MAKEYEVYTGLMKLPTVFKTMEEAEEWVRQYNLSYPLTPQRIKVEEYDD